VRTVETVEVSESTYLIGTRQGGEFEACPLCGAETRPGTGHAQTSCAPPTAPINAGDTVACRHIGDY
jgi:hypothetical protein